MLPKLSLRSIVTGLGLVLLGTACAPERVTAPVAPPAASAGLLSSVTGLVSGTVGGVLTTVTTVTRSTTLSRDISVTQTIGPEGGVISIPSAGLTVTFSPGAVSAPIAITATAYAGNKVAYGFEPHGIQFNAPVVVTQNMTLTTLSNNASALSKLAAGYTPNGVADLQPDGTALVSEILPVTTSITYGSGLLNSLLGIRTATASFVIRHFSGYILCGA
jgi:hypothetical protein